MRKFLKIMLPVLAALLCIDASAQRTSNGSWAADASYSFIGQGLDLGAARYTYLGYVDLGLKANYWGEYSFGASALDNSNVGDWYARAGYMVRALGSRNRAFSLYGGADGIIGYEKIQRWYVADGEEENVSGLAYGFLPKAEAELFVSESFAFKLDFAVMLNLNSPKTVVRYVAGVGVRYNFK